LFIGDLLNSIIFATITGKTRAQLNQFCTEQKLEREVIAFATDSICTTKKLNLNSKRLGDFSLDKQGNDVYYLQNGIYRFNGKWKKRGIGNLGNKQIEHLDTIEKDGKLYQVFNLLRVNRLRTAILSNSIEEIGKFKTVERLVNLNADRKRLWFNELKNIEDEIMIDSMPISLNYFEKSMV